MKSIDSKNPNRYLSTAVGLGTGLAGGIVGARMGARHLAKLFKVKSYKINDDGLAHKFANSVLGVVGGSVLGGTSGGLVSGVSGYKVSNALQNKYLEKIAFAGSIPKIAFAGSIPKILKDPILVQGSLGAGMGGVLGYLVTPKKVMGSNGELRNRTKADRWKNAATTGFVTGVYGAMRGGYTKVIDNAKGDFFKRHQSGGFGNKAREDFFKRRYGGHNGSAGGAVPPTQHDSVSDILKGLGAKSFKTKSEAKMHFRRAASKAHPDKGGSTVDMQRINSAWDKFQKHPDGFDKLAKLV